MARYVLAYGKPLGAPEGELTQWTQWSLTQSVRDPGKVQLSGIPGTHPTALEIEELVTDLWVYRDGVELFRGRVMSAVDEATEDASVTLNIDALDYRGLMSRRVIFHDMAWTDQEQASIAAALITEGQARDSMGVTIPPGQATGRVRTRAYPAGENVGKLLEQLGEVQDGFEWEVTPRLEFLVHYPSRGSTIDITLDLGGVLRTLKRRRDTSKVAHGVFGTGDMLATTPEFAWNAPAVPGTMLETSIAWGTVKEQDTLREHVEEQVAQMSYPWAVYDVTWTPGRWAPDVIDVGDVGKLLVQAGRLTELGTPVRVLERKITVNADGAENVSMALAEMASTAVTP